MQGTENFGKLSPQLTNTGKLQFQKQAENVTVSEIHVTNYKMSKLYLQSCVKHFFIIIKVDNPPSSLKNPSICWVWAVGGKEELWTVL